MVLNSLSLQQWALLLLLALVAGALLFQERSRGKGSEAKKLPPGPRPLPVLGNLLLFASFKSRHRDLYKLAQRYGPIMWLRLGSRGILVVQSRELAVEVLKNQDSVFAMREPPSFGVHLVTHGCKDVGFANYGPLWRSMRKLMTIQILTRKKIQEFQHVRVDEVSRLVESIRKHVGETVNLSYLLRVLNLNHMTRMGFGKAVVDAYEMDAPEKVEEEAVRKDEVEDHELVHIVAKSMEILGTRGIGDAIPWLRFLDNFYLPKAEFRENIRRREIIFTRIIQQHREFLEAHPETPSRDFVDALIRVGTFDGGGDMTDEIINSQIQDMLAGGSDTVALTTEWAMSEILRHPAVLKKAVQELQEVVGNERELQESDIASLPYLQSVVKEAMRIRPTLPFLVPHYTNEATTVGGYHIPAGTTVLVNIWALGRDPAYWQDPDRFWPERFLLHNPEVDVRGFHFELLPFGSGKRMCPGLGLAVAMVQLTVATLLHTFDWSLPVDALGSHHLDMTEIQGLATTRAVPLRAVPRLAASARSDTPNFRN